MGAKNNIWESHLKLKRVPKNAIKLVLILEQNAWMESTFEPKYKPNKGTHGGQNWSKTVEKT